MVLVVCAGDVQRVGSTSLANFFLIFILHTVFSSLVVYGVSWSYESIYRGSLDICEPGTQNTQIFISNIHIYDLVEIKQQINFPLNLISFEMFSCILSVFRIHSVRLGGCSGHLPDDCPLHKNVYTICVSSGIVYTMHVMLVPRCWRGNHILITFIIIIIHIFLLFAASAQVEPFRSL